MKPLLIILIVCSFFFSCRKDAHSCAKKELVGTYYSSALNKKIVIRKDDDDDAIGFNIELPELNGYSFIYFRPELELNDCSFKVRGFYDNYGYISSGTHYWLNGDGHGTFEPNSLILDFNFVITVNYNVNAGNEKTILEDEHISASFVKLN